MAIFGYTHVVLESMDLRSSVKHLLGELQSRSNALLSIWQSPSAIGPDLEMELEAIRKPLIELRDMRAAYPAEVRNVIYKYAPEVGEAYEAVSYVGELVEPANQRELADWLRRYAAYCNLRNSVP
jgi:hypothetical protein